jgi:superfamily II DNA or RNA helicase
MCYSAGTLNHCATVFKPHILIADEVHELATDRMFEMFNKFRHARMFCLSANDGDRFDGADFELEGIFGPVISSLTYPEALKHGMVVPIHVHWLHVEGEDPVGRSEGTAAWRWGIWRNEVRNQIIADCARNHPEDQVLITCQTLEHACFLKGLLPEFQLCYAPSESHDKKLDMYKGWKLLSADERRITQGKLNFMRQRFEEGKLKKVIATTVWNRGVSFDSLQVLIRADGSSDAINDTQIPGRLARTMEGKKHGIMYDFMDHFCKRYKRRSDDRRRDYAKKKWKQHIPERETDEPVLSRLRNSR